MATRQQLYSPANAFIQGRAARQQYDYNQNRNALAQMELDNAPREMKQRNALLDMQVQATEQGLSADKAKYAYATLKQAIDSGNPKAFVLQNVPDLVSNLQQRGVDLQSMDDGQAAQMLDGLARQMAGKAGIVQETMTPYQAEQIKLEREKMAQPKTMSPYEQARIDIERQKLNQKPSGPQFTPLTPDEIQAAGLPAGTSAQRDASTGKIDVLSKRDNTGVLSQKDQTTAKLKLNTVKLARKQLSDIRDAFEKGRAGPGPNAFGPGQGMLPTRAGKMFDARVNQMRSTLTALTRVPGVGQMSDYETKLDQAKFPQRNTWETVTEDQIRGLEDMLALIENGYTDLLSGGTQQESDVLQQGPGGLPKVGEVDGGYRFKGGDPSKPENWEKI